MNTGFNDLSKYLIANPDIAILALYVMPVIFILILLTSIGLTLGRIEKKLEFKNDAKLSTSDKKGDETLL